MAKTLNHYSQQIKALAPDAVALDRAKQLGDLLLQAKAAVKAAGKLWTDWLQSDCELTTRTAQRFMTIATRWDDPAFTEARSANPQLAIREADKVLAANSTRKTTGKQTPEGKAWERAFESAHPMTGHHCTHPTCCGYANAHPTRRLLCAGGGGSQPHDPCVMVSEAQDGFMVHPSDSAAKPFLPALLPLAQRIHAALPEATLFGLSCNSRLGISNAQNSSKLPPISIDLRSGQPVNALVGSILKETYIYGDANAMETKGDCRELIATWELLRAALGWGA